MDKVVYILGAGFSAPLGLPVMSNFIDKSKDLYFSEPDEFKYFARVFSLIKDLSVAKNYYEADLFNIEEILSLLEMRAQLGGGRLQKNFLRYLGEVVTHFTPDIQAYAQTLPGNWCRFVFGVGEHDLAYGLFVANLFNLLIKEDQAMRSAAPNNRFQVTRSASPSTSYSVVSLNYDRVLEKRCEFISSEFGVEEELSFQIDTDETLELWERPWLCKLHGGVGGDDIVPPTWSKGIARKMLGVWKKAYELLVQATHIRFLGYSMPESDSYVRYLLKTAVIEAPHLKRIDVLSKDSSGLVRARFDEFIKFPSYRFVRGDVLDYLRTHEGPSDVNRDNPVVEYAWLERYHERFFATRLQ